MDKRVFNHGKKGNKGGRRPTEKEEQEHLAAWFRFEDIEKLKKCIQSKKYSPWDMYRYLALSGDNRILQNWANKVLADLHEVKSTAQLVLSSEETEERKNNILKAKR
jgi:hypothetical protein